MLIKANHVFFHFPFKKNFTQRTKLQSLIKKTLSSKRIDFYKVSKHHLFFQK